MTSAGRSDVGAFDAGRPGGERFADGGFEPVGGWLSADAGGAESAAPGLVESAL
jgi:hypothetical protein